MPKPLPKTFVRAQPAAERATIEPWWLDAADGVCPHCLQTYVQGLHYHCSGCDGEVCAHCVIELRTQVEVFCPTCDESWEESS